MKRTLLVVAGMATMLCGLRAQAADFEEYARLVTLANSAHEALEGADPGLLPALRENALQRDLAVIEWLDAFHASEEFHTLSDEQQRLVYQDRYRNEYNASRLLIALDRCEEARDRARSLLDSGVNDPELRPRLTQTYEEAVACANRPRTATLMVEATPANADILVDGEYVGIAGASHSIGLGEHTLLVRADGYVTEEDTFTVSEAGQEVRLGPYLLAESDAAGSGPTWYEWTLWTVGVGGVTAGVLFFVEARDQEDQLENPPAGQVPVDPEGEEDTIDQLDMGAYISGGIGIAAILAGTISYLVRDKGTEQSAVTWGPMWFAQGGGAFIGAQF